MISGVVIGAKIIPAIIFAFSWSVIFNTPLKAPTLCEKSAHIILVQIISVCHKTFSKFVRFTLRACVGVGCVAHGEGGVAWVAYDVPEFVAKYRRLLPFFQLFVNDDCTSVQDSLPKAVDGGRQYSENHDAVQFFCDPKRIRCIMSVYQIFYA
nr:MAG TPA: hypothetical protein [Caudoviricetes sp.]